MQAVLSFEPLFVLAQYGNQKSRSPTQFMFIASHTSLGTRMNLRANTIQVIYSTTVETTAQCDAECVQVAESLVIGGFLSLAVNYGFE